MNKNLNTRLLEAFLILFILAIIICGGAFYYFNFTDAGKVFFNGFFSHEIIDDGNVQLVEPKKTSHNQIIIHLSDSEIMTQSIPENGQFQYEFSKGLKIATEWPITESGFLVFSPNQGQTISLVGYGFLNTDQQIPMTGIEVLQTFDSNADLKIDAADINYNLLYVWVDKNRNGKLDDDELFSLKQLGIVSINLDSIQNVQHPVMRSTIIAKGTYTLENGTTKSFVDIDLFQNPFYRTFTDKLPFNSTIQNFPDVRASGFVRDLRDASVFDIKLFVRVATYLKITDAEKQLRELDRLLFDWVLASNTPFLEERAKSLSTLNFIVDLDNALLINNYLDISSNKEAALRKARVLEAFFAEPLINFIADEKFNPVTKEWELAISTVYKNQLVSKKTFINKALNDPITVQITTDMIPLSDDKIITINNNYSALKSSVLEEIKQQIKIVNVLSESNWITRYIKNKIEASQKYHYVNQWRGPDIRRRHVMECIKPNNVVDEQVINCAAGKIPKTW